MALRVRFAPHAHFDERDGVVEACPAPGGRHVGAAKDVRVPFALARRADVRGGAVGAREKMGRLIPDAFHARARIHLRRA